MRCAVLSSSLKDHMSRNTYTCRAKGFPQAKVPATSFEAAAKKYMDSLGVWAPDASIVVYAHVLSRASGPSVSTEALGCSYLRVTHQTQGVYVTRKSTNAEYLGKEP